MEKRVLQICSYYSDSKLYGNLFEQLNRFSKSEGYYFTDDRADITGIPEDFYISNRYKKWERFIFKRKHEKVYQDLLKQVDPNEFSFSHAHSLMSNGYISYRLYLEYGLKYVVAVRRTDLYYFLKYKPYMKSLAKNILKCAEYIIFISPAHMKKTSALFDKCLGEELIKKSRLIPNGIEPVFLNNLYNRTDEEVSEHLKKRPKVISIGKLDDPNKNIKNLIRGIEILNSSGNLFKLVLVGRLNKPKYKKLIEGKEFITHIPPTDELGVLRELRDSHILAVPSFTETFGLVYPEAISQGLPVIYTRGQGFDGYFPEGETGYSVNPKSPRDIAEKIADLYVQLDKIIPTLPEKALRFSWERIGEEYREIYENVESRTELKRI